MRFMTLAGTNMFSSWSGIHRDGGWFGRNVPIFWIAWKQPRAADKPSGSRRGGDFFDEVLVAWASAVATYWATVRRWHYAASGRASGEEELAGIKSPAEAGLRSGRNATSWRAEVGGFSPCQDQKENPAEAGQGIMLGALYEQPLGDRGGDRGRPAALPHT